MDQTNNRDDALFEALSKSKKKKKRRTVRTVIIVLLVLAVGLAAGVFFLRRQVTKRFASSKDDVVSAQAGVGSISTQVSGSGTLLNVDEENILVPAGVTVEKLLVSAQESMTEGQLLAMVDLASVQTAMSSVQSELKTLDKSITSAAKDTVDSRITAGVAGRVKLVYAEKGDDVAKVMYEHGALAVLSLDGTMAVEIGAGGLALFLFVSILLARWAVKPVEHAWEQQRQFVADASHELKTPLTVILTDTELLQSGSCTEEDNSRFLGSIRTMSEQMRGLVEELLSLTRADNTDARRAQQPMDWSKCVADAILPFEPVFYENGLALESEIEDGVSVKGSEVQLRQVTEILLDNAKKYCAPNTATRVVLKRQGRHALLTVENLGEEIAKDELEKIFLRFYRLDKARSMNHSYGLGLAIARQIVESHKGKIWAESGGGINRFCVQLPAE